MKFYISRINSLYVNLCLPVNPDCRSRTWHQNQAEQKINAIPPLAWQLAMRSKWQPHVPLSCTISSCSPKRLGTQPALSDKLPCMSWLHGLAPSHRETVPA
ncbi:hypothetical protein DPEC_G00020700 [Dallia pectoralis]|uniref:Uncharacterized protein n=1 Tax=Dallia pectoralis TaxID=75939 RepID=A0ACC2HG07_DALPE|nr:hypothetical protein DPEC_G00020700 [Dallia pectoralis]